jgi:hypothetical protein
MIHPPLSGGHQSLYPFPLRLKSTETENGTNRDAIRAVLSQKYTEKRSRAIAGW